VAAEQVPAVLSLAGEHRIQDVTCEPASLEDLFLRHYEEHRRHPLCRHLKAEVATVLDDAPLPRPPSPRESSKGGARGRPGRTEACDSRGPGWGGGLLSAGQGRPQRHITGNIGDLSIDGRARR